jgi:hypothetical protein
MLRLAACLEEHYPHPIANAVVAEARRRSLAHEEHHSEVEYIVAHGISCHVGEEKVIIGSHHFVFQDEGCVVPEGEQARFEALPAHCSHLFLAISGQLAAVLCIEDPLRQEAPEVVRRLHAAGLRRIVMMTGDSRKAAQAAAQAVGVDEYDAEVLPEDKAAFIRREREAKRIGERQMEAERQKEDEKKYFQRDAADFIDVYGKETFDKLMKDEDFADYADGKIGKRPLTDIFERYQRLSGKAERVGREKREDKAARSTGSGSGTGANNGLSTSEKAALDNWNQRYPNMKMTEAEWKKR